MTEATTTLTRADFDVVKKATEWPTYDQSIKTLAQFLGFQWRDEPLGRCIN